MSSTAPNDFPDCRRCGRPVATSDVDLFEGMHYICFHYEFEHNGVDVDEECSAGGCPARRVDLHRTLAEWTDWDAAAFALGRAIGFYETPGLQRFKSDFWTDNSVGNGLHHALVVLAESGIVERRDAPEIQFRWATRNRRAAED